MLIREREVIELTQAVHRTSSRIAPREAVLPLYCSLSAPEAIHHTTHWSRVLHHNGGLNQYKSRVPCVVPFRSLDPSDSARNRQAEGRISTRTPEFEPPGSAGTRNPTVREGTNINLHNIYNGDTVPVEPLSNIGLSHATGHRMNWYDGTTVRLKKIA